MTDSTRWSAPDPGGSSRPEYSRGQAPAMPGVIPLRPLTLGEILQGAINTMRRHAGVVFGASAVVALVSAGLLLVADLWIVDLYIPAPAIDPNASPEVQLDQALAALSDNLRVLAVIIVISLLTQTFLAGFLTIVVGRAVLGRPIGITDAWQELRPRLWPLFGLTVIVTLLVVAGMVAFVVPGIWAFVVFSLATPALILERGGIGEAMRRSPVLVRGSWWRVFGVLVVALIVNYAVSELIQWPFSLAAGTPTATGGLTLITALGNAAAATITVPFLSLVTALLYIDQRMRKEGLDAELTRAAGPGCSAPN